MLLVIIYFLSRFTCKTCMTELGSDLEVLLKSSVEVTFNDDRLPLFEIQNVS